MLIEYILSFEDCQDKVVDYPDHKEHLVHPYKLVDRLQYGCGLRISEGCRLRVKDSNFDIRTTMIYTHCIPSRTIKEAKSPLDF